MARIRTIKPEFWTSEQIVDCSPTARLLFIGLWNFCDDQGVHTYSPKQIKMEVFPGDDFTPGNVEKLLDELIRHNLIKTYHIENKRYLIVTGWNHQKIEKPNKRHPLPIKFDDHSTTTRRPFDDPSPPEGKGRESKGRESIKEPADAPFSLPSKEEIQESSDPKIEEYIQQVCKRLYEEKIFPEVNAFKNKMIKGKKNGRGVLHVLTRCYIARPDDPWGYCQKIISVEDGNYNESDYRKTAQ